MKRLRKSKTKEKVMTEEELLHGPDSQTKMKEQVEVLIVMVLSMKLN